MGEHSRVMQLLEPGSAEYKGAFELSIGMGSGGPSLEARLDYWTTSLASRHCAVHWGAGTGRATALLARRFERVYAVEPSPEMRRGIGEVAPKAILLEGDLASATPPEPVDFALINHVLYHVPDTQWSEVALRCAHQLSDAGMLCIAMKHPSAGCGEMLEHFGAERFDLFGLLAGFRDEDAFAIEFLGTPGRLETRSFEDTLRVARFMLSDRPAHAFSRLGSEAAFEAYVRGHFWNASVGRGGWDNPKLYALIRRSPFL